MLINDLHTEIDKQKEFESGAVVNESHKQSSPCSSKDRGSLESNGHMNKQHNETTKRIKGGIMKLEKKNHEINRNG